MPRYNPSNKQGYKNAIKYVDYCKSKGLFLDQKAVKETRSNLQNRALHKYYSMLAEELLNVGYDFNYTNPFTGEIVPIPYTKDLVKEYIWKPLQEAIFKIESTTELTTNMINDILEVISNWLVKLGITVKFPNKFDLLVKQLNKSDKLNNN